MPKNSGQIGHNIAADQLRSIIDRIEKMNEEADAIKQDIREIYAESKANGFCTRALRQIVKLRQKDASEREEEEAILSVYMQHLGMLPLFDQVED